MVAASRIAAAREAQEESGLLPKLEDMVLLSHWTTPEGEPRRFSTWIYAAPLAVDDEVGRGARRRADLDRFDDEYSLTCRMIELEWPVDDDRTEPDDEP